MFLILDSSESAHILKRILKSAGHKVLVAKTNQQAIKLLDEHVEAISCIIADPYLRHNSAFEFLYEMRSYKDMSDITLVVYSSERIPKSVTQSLDWRLLDITKVFYKSTHSVSEITAYVSTVVNSVG